MLQSLVGGPDIHMEIRVLPHVQGVVQVTVFYSTSPIYPVPQHQPVVYDTGHQENQYTNYGHMVQTQFLPQLAFFGSVAVPGGFMGQSIWQLVARLTGLILAWPGC